MPTPLARLLASFSVAAAVTLALFAGTTGGALARDGDRAGVFDFWVLSLSWSPSFCEATGDARRDVQCARPFAFVVHGLWPQYLRGFPSDCPTGEPGPNRADVDAVLPAMPSPGLVFHEWRTHGTCSGLSASSYFRVIRRVFETIRIPAEFTAPVVDRTVAPGDVEAAFRRANPGLGADMIAVDCDRRRLREVRICLKKDLSSFTACPEVDRRACRADRVHMPATR